MQPAHHAFLVVEGAHRYRKQQIPQHPGDRTRSLVVVHPSGLRCHPLHPSPPQPLIGAERRADRKITQAPGQLDRTLDRLRGTLPGAGRRATVREAARPHNFSPAGGGPQAAARREQPVCLQVRPTWRAGLWFSRAGPPGSARRPRCRPALPGGCHPPLLSALPVGRKRRRLHKTRPRRRRPRKARSRARAGPRRDRLGEGGRCGGRLGRVGLGLVSGSEEGQAICLAVSQTVGSAARHRRPCHRAGRAAAFGFFKV